MATTIVPALGAGILFTQGGTGASPGYAAIDRRRAYTPPLQAGVIGATDFKVVQRGAGANMSVDITMTAGGEAYVAGTSVNGQALYAVPVHASTVNEAIAAAHATLPRIDSVYLVVQDDAHDASGQNRAQIQVVTGTATGGATLDNRTGAGAAPASSLLLADVLIVALDASITNSEIRDRRRWARGAYRRIVRNANAAAGSDYTTASAALVDLDATNLAPRIELSGAPVRIRLSGRWTHSAAGAAIGLAFIDNGAGIDGATGRMFNAYNAGAGTDNGTLNCMWDFVPAAGSHILKPQWLTSGATATIMAQATQPLVFTIEELVRQNADNS